MMLTTMISAQIELPYYTGFDNEEEQSGWENYEISSGSRSYQWNYSSFDFKSSPTSLRMGSPYDEDVYIENWFVSPEFDFSNGGVIDSLYYRYTGMGATIEGDGDTMAIYLLVGSPDPLLANEKYLIHFFNDTVTGSEGEWERKDNINIPAVNQPAFLGFRHKTDAGWINLNIDNIYVNDTALLSVNEVKENNIAVEVYPNPFENTFSISGVQPKEIMQISLYDLNGKKIGVLPKNQAVFSMGNYASGCYLLEVETLIGIGRVRLIKE